MSTLTKHLNPIRNMFLLDNEDYDPFTDFFTTFGKALNTDRRLTDTSFDGPDELWRGNIETNIVINK